MMDKQLTVIDLESGIGGRAYAFAKAGFEISAVIERDEGSGPILRQMLPRAPILLGKMYADTVPVFPADVLSMYVRPLVSRQSVRNGKDRLPKELFSEMVWRCKPKAFLLQLPPAIMSNAAIAFLGGEIIHRYKISYQVCRNVNYSGYPTVTNQAYFVGLREDIAEKPFSFPLPRFETPQNSPFQENPDEVEEWYRNISPRLEVFPEGGFPYYYRDYKGNLTGSKHIIVSAAPESYCVDLHGLRRLTPNEIARLKGYQEYDFNQWPNRRQIYQKLRIAPDIYIMSAIAESLLQYLEAAAAERTAPVRVDAFEKPEVYEERVPPVKRDSAGKKPKPPEPAAIIKPKNRITNLRIDHLKGLDHLEISFQKRLTAIMGVNGVGKSTILHALACMFSPAGEGENHKFNYFFTPTPDASWQGSRFQLTYFDENTQSPVTRTYQKVTDRWSPKYASRPKCDVFYLGIETGLPEIEKESQTSYIDYRTKEVSDRLTNRIISAAAQILNKDYEFLTNHKAKKKELFGVHTRSDITYSSLSMGAGEQRLIRILTTVYRAPPYSMVLIDEIELLLHTEAQKRLIAMLHKIAEDKKLQIIFTTHSLAIGGQTDFVDIRYLFRLRDKTMVYDRITPYIISEIDSAQKPPLTVYVEDDLAQAVVFNIAEGLKLSRYVQIQNIGSAHNAFSLAAGLVIQGERFDDKLIVLDGDVYCTAEEKRKQLEKVLSGTEANHEEKIASALSAIVQFSLERGTPPEKHIYDMLIALDCGDELTDCAKRVQTALDSHDWLDQIVAQMNHERKIVLYQIMDRVCEHPDWSEYVGAVRDWLLKKRETLKCQPL